MPPTKFRLNWLSKFREEYFQKSTNLKKELPVAAMFANESGQNKQSLQRTFHRCFLPNFSSFGKVVSETIFFLSINQKQEWPVAPMFVYGSELNEQSYRGPSIYASYQVSAYLAQWYQRKRFFLKRPIRNENCLCRPCLLIDLHKMSNLYKEPFIDTSYQVLVHLAEGFQRRILKCEKLKDDGRRTTDDRRQTPSNGKSSDCLWQRELKINFCNKYG